MGRALSGREVKSPGDWHMHSMYFEHSFWNIVFFVLQCRSTKLVWPGMQMDQWNLGLSFNFRCLMVHHN